MNKIIGLVITALVSIIVLAAVLIPVINDATDTEDTFTNEGLWRMKEIVNGDVWTRTALDGGGYAWNYDGVQQLTNSTGSNALLGDDWCVRSNGQGRGATLSGNATSVTATAGEITIALVGLSGSDQNLPGYGVYTNGEYLLKRDVVDTYVLGDSVLYGTGVTGVDDIGFIVHVEGNVKDGVTFSAYSNKGGATLSNVVFSNVTVNAVAVDGYKDLYKFTSATADIAFDSTSGEETTSHTGSITYNSIVVPYEVTAEKAQHLSPAEIEILDIIPMFIIIAVLIAAVAAVAFRRE